MSEVTNYHYQKIRNYTQAECKYIELQNQLGEAIVRISASDPRVSWIHEEGAQVLEMQLVLRGYDLGLPVVIAASAIFDQEVGGEAMSVQSISPAVTIDELHTLFTHIHKLEIPRVI